ncbi:MAG TPA: hypothetical protein H9731_06595, partial [Candidatus Borkfalkia excrementipullorum]|nr:hypothetical protein [Candidatus Borkfalkia excrementipullorum]
SHREVAAEKLLRLSGTSSTSSAAGTMRLKRLIKPPAQPVVLDYTEERNFKREFYSANTLIFSRNML